MKINDYFDFLDGELRAISFSTGVSEVEALAEYAAKILELTNEVPGLDPCELNTIGPGRKRIRIESFGFDEIDKTLYVLISDPAQVIGEDTLTKTEADVLLAQLRNFVEISTEHRLRAELPNSEVAAEVAHYISQIWPTVARVRLLLVTTKKLSDRAKSFSAEPIGSKPVDVHIWDVTRFYMLNESTTGREEIVIDLKDFGSSGGLEVLNARTAFSGTRTLLTVIRGDVLARIFEAHGSRLLEGNVRTFLSARGAVNKGIRTTIANDPERFLAYNNGITATSTEITISQDGLLVAIRDLQIVNGGQTTASLYNFYKSEKEKAKNLESVFVAVKLIVVEPALVEDLVPYIAQYANSQNKVSDADLASNNAFHRRMEDLSKTLVAPARNGSQISTRWYYERARGSYENDRARSATSSVALKKFDSLHPKNQKIDKTDLAKFHSIKNMKPHLASRGGQKNFASFKNEISTKYETEAGRATFGDDYYKQIVCTKIMYDTLSRAVRQADWFGQGYLANIVAYGISKFVRELARAGLALPWAEVWQKQAISDEMLSELLSCSRLALQSLLIETRQQQNVTEWAKTEACWQHLEAKTHSLGQEFLRQAVTAAEARESKSEGLERTKQLSELEVMSYLDSVPLEYWDALLENKSARLSPSDRTYVSMVLNRKTFELEKRKLSALVELINRSYSEADVPKPATS